MTALTVEDLSGDVHPHLQRLRESAPVAWVPAINGWLVTGWQAAVDVLLDAKTFTVDDPRFTTAQVVGPSMLSTDGVAHSRQRSPFMAPFRSSVVRGPLQHWIEERADSLVAGLPRGTPIELRTALAAPLAVDTIIEALGLSADTNSADVLAWYRSIVDSVAEVTAGHGATSAGATAMASLGRVVEAAIARNQPPLSTMASSADLTTTELVANTAVVMFGAIETSEAMIANLIHHLLAQSGLWNRVQADRSLVAAAVEESLRMEPAAAIVDRYATADITIGGADVKKGDYVSVSLAGANRDPARFAEPHRFLPARENSRDHLAFVRGPHACIGASMARVEAAAALNALLDCGGVERDATASTSPTGHVFRKAHSVTASLRSR